MNQNEIQEKMKEKLDQLKNNPKYKNTMQDYQAAIKEASNAAKDKTSKIDFNTIFDSAAKEASWSPELTEMVKKRYANEISKRTQAEAQTDDITIDIAGSDNTQNGYDELS